VNLPEPIQSIYESRFFLALFSIFLTQVYNYVFKPSVDRLIANFVPFNKKRALLSLKEDYLAVYEYKQGTRDITLESANSVAEMVTWLFVFLLSTGFVIAEGMRLNGKELTVQDMFVLLSTTLASINCLVVFVRNKRSLDARCYIFSNFEHFKKKFAEIGITLSEQENNSE